MVDGLLNVRACLMASLRVIYLVGLGKIDGLTASENMVVASVCMVDGPLHGRIWWRVHEERSRLWVERGVGEVSRELVHSNVHLSI